MEKRESELIEFKKSTSELKQGVISLSSMLNKHGKGTVYFGVLNDGSINGQQIGKDTTHDISVEIKNHIKPVTVPTIETVEEDGKTIIKVSVKGNDKPYSAYGRYYIRSDDEDLAIENEMLYELFNKKALDYSAWENETTSHGLDAVDEDRVIKYFNEANQCGRIKYVYKDLKESLQKLELLVDGKLNNAGYYLFSKNKPIKLKLAVFNSEDRISFSHIELYEGNIFDCIEYGIEFISRFMRWPATIVGSKRVETPEIPLEAIREIVVNSFAHAKYEDANAVMNMIYFTPYRIKIINAGGLLKGTSPEDYASGKKGPVLRNPLIDIILYKNNTIDSFATGFERTIRLCSEKNIKYEYEDNGYEFSFSFIRSNDTNNDTINDTKENREQDILNIIKRNKYSTRESIAAELGVSTATVGRELQKLQKMGLIKRIGSNKNGYWEISR